MTTSEDIQSMITYRSASHPKTPGIIIKEIKSLIGTFKLGYPRLTSMKGPKVISDCIRRLPGHDIMWVSFISHNPRSNNK